MLAWFAGQDDLTDAFRNKEDVYVKMAARIYETSEDQITKDQRFVGKTTILALAMVWVPSSSKRS